MSASQHAAPLIDQFLLCFMQNEYNGKDVIVKTPDARISGKVLEITASVIKIQHGEDVLTVQESDVRSIKNTSKPSRLPPQRSAAGQ